MPEQSRFEPRLSSSKAPTTGLRVWSDGSRIAPTSLFKTRESFSSHFAADHLSLQASSSAAETGSWRIAQAQTSLVSFGSLRNTGRAATS